MIGLVGGAVVAGGTRDESSGARGSILMVRLGFGASPGFAERLRVAFVPSDRARSWRNPASLIL